MMNRGSTKLFFAAGISAAFIIAAPVRGQSIQRETGQAKQAALATSALSEIMPEVEARLSLIHSEWVRIPLPETPDDPFEVRFPIRGIERTLRLRQQSALSSGYRLIVQSSDGTLSDATPGPVRTLRGEIEGWPGSATAMSLLNEGLEGVIHLPDGERIWIQPLTKIIPGAAREDHVLYEGGDVLPVLGVCDTPGGIGDGEPDGGGTARGDGPCGANFCVAELANDTDFEFFQRYGSVEAVEARIQSVVNTVNLQYEQEAGITHEISAIVVRTAEPDPYDTDTQPQLLPEYLVNQVQFEWETNLKSLSRDLTQLFTDKDMNGVVGRAKAIGAVCNNQAYCINRTDFSDNLSFTTNLHAHELGHLWNTIHCNLHVDAPPECTCFFQQPTPPPGACPDPPWTMHFLMTGANQFLPQDVALMSAYRDGRTCLHGDESGTATLPFSDTFPGTVINAALWTGIESATVNNLANNEPTPVNALNLDGNFLGGDQVRSAAIDLTGAARPTLSYRVQPGGTANMPEVGDDLTVEIYGRNNTWIEINRHVIGEPGLSNLNFKLAALEIPAAERHAGFRLRFRAASRENGNDDWFIDNVTLTAGSGSAPTPNPMVFLQPPAPTSFSTVSMEAVAATDPLFPPVEYRFDVVPATGPGANDSGWQTSRTYVDTNLAPNNEYSYQVRARNGANPPIETLPSPTATAVTPIEAPTGVVFGAVSTSSIEVTALDSFTALSAPDSGLFFEMTPDVPGSGANEWRSFEAGEVTTINVTGLPSGTEFTFRVKARNRAGVETDFSPEASVSTGGQPACERVGDLDGNGVLDGRDVPGFVRAKLGVPIQGDFPACANYGVGTLTGDIEAFTNDLLAQ